MSGVSSRFTNREKFTAQSFPFSRSIVAFSTEIRSILDSNAGTALALSDDMSAMRHCRYDLHLPVWYRVQGERSWHTGTTESVSRSGVMIRTHERNELNGLVRVVIELPNENGSGTAGCLTGIGHVVRAQNADRSDPPSFVIAVKRYRVQRRDHVSPSHG